ncbi:MAG: class I SAM-dependent methyltransferase [Ignavibacteria bacterium]|nr:class I SAM-dependent methyltransferase [Ignavibacteria bacterium]
MKRKEEIKDFYDKFSKNLIRDKIYPNPRHKKIISYLKKVFQNYNFNSALEIGCGIGIISEFIAKNIPSVTGLDISEENIKFAKATNKKVSFYCSDFLDYPVKNNYDLITLFDVLEHIPKEIHPDVFRKISDLSNANSIIIMTIPDPYYLSYIREYSPEKLQLVDESIYPDEMIQIFKQNNLEVIMFEKYGIDNADQYNLYLLHYKKKQYELTPVSQTDKNLLIDYFGKLVNRIKRISGQIRYGKYLK